MALRWVDLCRDPLIGLVCALLAIGVVARLAGRLAAPGATRPGLPAADPLDPAALADAGFLFARRGEAASADAIFTFAGERSWRDWRVQDRLLEQAIRAKRWDQVMAHADALLRTDPQGVLQPAVFRLLDAAASQSVPRAALLDRLAQRPWWRKAYLRRLVTGAAAAPKSPTDAGAILSGLAATSAPAGPDEYQPYLAGLIADDRYSEAIAAWRTLARRRDAFDLVRDGDFAAASDGSDFTWRSASGAGVWSEIVHDRTGAALHVAYDGVSSPVLPGQLLVLAPGRYRLTWRERTSGPPRLAWRVRCAGQAQAVADAAAARPPTSAWADRAITFAIPAQACPAQWLELNTDPGERRADVDAWYAQMTLVAVRWLPVPVTAGHVDKADGPARATKGPRRGPRRRWPPSGRPGLAHGV
jgi:hypothetical protein